MSGKNPELCQRPYCRERWTHVVRGFTANAPYKKHWTLYVCADHAEPYSSSDLIGGWAHVYHRRNANQDANLCEYPGCTKPWTHFAVRKGDGLFHSPNRFGDGHIFQYCVRHAKGSSGLEVTPREGMTKFGKHLVKLPRMDGAEPKDDKYQTDEHGPKWSLFDDE